MSSDTFRADLTETFFPGGHATSFNKLLLKQTPSFEAKTPSFEGDVFSHCSERSWRYNAVAFRFCVADGHGGAPRGTPGGTAGGAPGGTPGDAWRAKIQTKKGSF